MQPIFLAFHQGSQAQRRPIHTIVTFPCVSEFVHSGSALTSRSLSVDGMEFIEVMFELILMMIIRELTTPSVWAPLCLCLALLNYTTDSILDVVTQLINMPKIDFLTWQCFPWFQSPSPGDSQHITPDRDGYFADLSLPKFWLCFLPSQQKRPPLDESSHIDGQYITPGTMCMTHTAPKPTNLNDYFENAQQTLRHGVSGPARGDIEEHNGQCGISSTNSSRNLYHETMSRGQTSKFSMSDDGEWFRSWKGWFSRCLRNFWLVIYVKIDVVKISGRNLN